MEAEMFRRKFCILTVIPPGLLWTLVGVCLVYALLLSSRHGFLGLLSSLASADWTRL